MTTEAQQPDYSVLPDGTQRPQSMRASTSSSRSIPGTRRVGEMALLKRVTDLLEANDVPSPQQAKIRATRRRVLAVIGSMLASLGAVLILMYALSTNEDSQTSYSYSAAYVSAPKFYSQMIAAAGVAQQSCLRELYLPNKQTLWSFGRTTFASAAELPNAMLKRYSGSIGTAEWIGNNSSTPSTVLSPADVGVGSGLRPTSLLLLPATSSSNAIIMMLYETQDVGSGPWTENKHLGYGVAVATLSENVTNPNWEETVKFTTVGTPVSASDFWPTYTFQKPNSDSVYIYFCATGSLSNRLLLAMISTSTLRDALGASTFTPIHERAIFWNGKYGGEAAFNLKMFETVPILSGGIGTGISMHYDSVESRYFLFTPRDKTKSVDLMTAGSPWGPWSSPNSLLTTSGAVECVSLHHEYTRGDNINNKTTSVVLSWEDATLKTPQWVELSITKTQG